MSEAVAGFAPKTAKERKAAERERRLTQGLKRLELWAPTAHHPKIKQFAAKLAKEKKR